jgi:hypothetical protein
LTTKIDNYIKEGEEGEEEIDGSGGQKEESEIDDNNGYPKGYMISESGSRNSSPERSISFEEDSGEL